MGTARRSGSGSLAVGHIRAANCRHLPLPLRALQLSTTAEKRKWHFLRILADLAGWEAAEAGDVTGERGRVRGALIAQ